MSYTILNKYRYRITDRLGTGILNPLGESKLTVNYDRENEQKADYKEQIGSKITLVKSDYHRLYKLERSVYRCSDIFINVDRLCEGEWIFMFVGRLVLNEGEWDLDRCNVTIPIQKIDLYVCLESGKDQEADIFDAPYDRVTVGIYDPAIEIETTGCSYVDTPCNCTLADLVAGKWTEYSSMRAQPPAPGEECFGNRQYAREFTLVPPGTVMDSSWTFLGVVGADEKWIRPARVYDCVYTSTPSVSTKLCKIVGLADEENPELAEIDNGVLLGDLLTYLLQLACPDYTVKSEFFQIDPDVVTDINYVTGILSTTNNPVLFQKSDIKRPYDLNNASRGTITLEKLIEWLCTMFNLQYRISGNVFRIEHVSYWNRSAGFDLTEDKWLKFSHDKRKYTYDTQKIPKKDTYTFMEARYKDFTGLPIEYDTPCAGNDGKTTEIKHPVDKITTDIEWCLANSDGNSSAVSDEGFVLVSVFRNVGGDMFINTGAPILDSVSRLNNVFGWAYLHRDFHRHARPYYRGKMNNVVQDFLSTIPTKRGERITIPLCCDENFDPFETITTQLGVGIVDKATFNFKDSTLELEILYAADDDLVTNDAPVAENDVVFTYVDVPIDIDELANDSDTDPDATINAVEIVEPPLHGTAVVLPNNQIRYTPNSGYFGDDLIVYRFLDNWNEPSNNALISITVRNNEPPEADPDSYTTIQDTLLTVGAPGVLANDSDDWTTPPVITTYDATSVNGGTVTMAPDGSFTYMPASGFTGDDTFTYTIEDELGLTDTATVTIHVAAEGMEANDDSYSALLGETKSFAAGIGVLINDVSSNGGIFVQGAPTTLPTTAGGTVDIAADGSFTYHPPSSPTPGTDTFTYTAEDSGAATDTATVTITILDVVYVKKSTRNCVTTDVVVTCSGSPRVVGDQTNCEIWIEYYADSAGTIPLDITGYGLTINRRIVTTVNATVTTANSTFGSGSGTEHYLQNLVTHRYQENCMSTTATTTTRVFSIQPGIGYVAI